MRAKVKAERPLSPHLQIYRWQITMVMSILHRATGFGLSVGTILVAVWLWSAAYSPECYEWLQTAADHWIGRVFLFGWTFAFFYHLGNGVRHLLWDVGRGFTIPNVYRSGAFVWMTTIILTASVWLMALSH